MYQLPSFLTVARFKKEVPRSMRDQVGQIDVANGARKSHPLTLSQLLVGYHAVKAAMGARAY
jgi:hypothetical protein